MYTYYTSLLDRLTVRTSPMAFTSQSACSYMYMYTPVVLYYMYM